MGHKTETMQTFSVEAAGATDIGLSRKFNEDCVVLRPDLDLFLVADGAGGHNAGNVASALGATTVAHTFEERISALRAASPFDGFGIARAAWIMSQAIHRANAEIALLATASNRHQGMGSTLVAAHFTSEHALLHVGHVGDSRLFRLRDGQLEQLTQDHSLLQDILETRPELDESTLSRLPRAVVTRALGMQTSLRPTVKTFEVITNDRYLLCSDGLTDVLDGNTLCEILGSEGSPEEHVRALIERALQCRADDNVAVVVVHCQPVEGEAMVRRFAPEVRRQHQVLPTLSTAAEPEIIIVDEDAELAEDPTLRLRILPKSGELPPHVSEVVAVSGASPKKKPG